MAESASSRLEKLFVEMLADPRAEAIEKRLASMKVPVAKELCNPLVALFRKTVVDNRSARFLSRSIAAFLDSPDASLGLTNLLRYVEQTADPRSFIEALAGARPMLDLLSAVFSGSQYMSDILVRNPGLLYWLLEKENLQGVDTCDRHLQSMIEEMSLFGTFQGKLDALKRYQRRILLKIGVRDFLGMSSIEETTAALSDLAESIVDATLNLVWEEQWKRIDKSNGGGEDQPPPSPHKGGFAVVALGKLGARELNYSSDIDLVYVCDDAGERSRSFYQNIATALTTALTSMSDEGYLYRVDLRLRPDGESGPIVSSLEAMRIYYETRGRPWEFQAYLKARMIAGDSRTGNALLKLIDGLVFNPSLPYSPLHEIGLLRKRIQDAISIRAKTFNIKLMEGGIRDIEFIAQTLQLLHGATDREIRTPNTIDALRRLSARGYIEAGEANGLIEAYRFLRLVEHRLQMMHQIKTHSVPESEREMELLARRASMGPIRSLRPSEFLEKLSEHLKMVRVVGAKFFEGEPSSPEALLLMLPEKDPRVEEILSKHKIEQPERAIRVLHSMAYGSFPRLLDRRAREMFARLLPNLLACASSSGDPLIALIGLANLAQASGNERSFYALLSEDEHLMALVVDFTGLSSNLTGVLARYPAYIDYVFTQPRALLSSLEERERGAWSAELPIRFEEELALSRAASLVVDMAESTFPEQLARVYVATARRNVPWMLEEAFCGEEFVLFSLGSFATGEVRFKSDLDLLVTAPPGIPPRKAERATKAIHKLIGALSERAGIKLDFRLRAEGAGSPLLQDLAAYREYFRRRMSPWEKVAFAKCAPWGGDERIATEFVSELSSVLGRPFQPREIDALASVRRDLESLVPEKHSLWETKRSAGGRYDLEYLSAVGMAMIVEKGSRYPFSLTTAERLDRLAQAGLMSQDELSVCKAALRLFTLIEYLLELHDFSLPRNKKQRQKTAAYLARAISRVGPGVSGCESAEDMERSITEAKRRVRRTFENVLRKAR